MAHDFAARFMLSDPVLAGRELLADAGHEVIAWINEGLRSGGYRSGYGELPEALSSGEWEFGEGTFVVIRGCADGEEEHWLVTFQHEHFRRARVPQMWRTDVRLTSIGDEVELDLRVTATSLVAVVPPRLSAIRPRLLLTLVSCYDATIGGRRLVAQPVPIGPEDCEQLASELTNPRRRLPAVVVSAAADGSYLLDPDWLADRLVANAIVYQAKTAGVGDHLSNLVGWRFRCAGGDVCEYLPRFVAHPRYGPASYWRTTASLIDRNGADRCMASVVGRINQWVAAELENFEPYWETSVREASCGCELVD